MRRKWIVALVAALLGCRRVRGQRAGDAEPGAGLQRTILAKATVRRPRSQGPPADHHGRPDGKTHPNGVWLAWLKTHGSSDLYVVDNKFAPNGGTSGWHSHPGPSRDLRRRRHRHELLQRRARLRAAGLHRRTELRRPRRRRRAQDRERGQLGHRRDDRRADPPGRRHPPHRRAGTRRMPRLKGVRSRAARVGGEPAHPRRTGKASSRDPRGIAPATQPSGVTNPQSSPASIAGRSGPCCTELPRPSKRRNNE